LKLQRLHQGHRTVDEYFQDLETTLTKMNMHDNEESKIKRFVSGLRSDIEDIVEFYGYSSLKKVIHLAIKVETKILNKTTFKHTHDDLYSSSWKDTNKNLQQLLLPLLQKKPILSKKFLNTTFLPLPLSHPPKLQHQMF